MRLASLKQGRDGALVVVRRDGRAWARAAEIRPTLQAALDDWPVVLPALRELQRHLDAGEVPGEPLDPAALAAPLPRAYEWLDGSSFLAHVERVRRARGAPLPPRFREEPLVYQGGSGAFLGPTDAIPLAADGFGLDVEAEIVAITTDIPMATSAHDAHGCVALIGLCNDLTLRSLVSGELAKGFGFVVSKPATQLAPFVVTPDELGAGWRDGRAALRVDVHLDGERLGACDSGEAHFGFGDLLAHVTRTRSLVAGTLVGSGTVSNADETRGFCCLVEKRAVETTSLGEARTPYLVPGARIRIEAFDQEGRSPFGAIDARVEAYPGKEPRP